MNKDIKLQQAIDNNVPLMMSIEDLFSNKENKKVLSSWSAATFWGFSPLIDTTLYITCPKGYNPNINKKYISVKQRAGTKYNQDILTFDYEGMKVNVYSPERTIVEIIKETKNSYTDVIVETIRNFFKNIKYSVNKLREMAKSFKIEHIVEAFMAVYNG